MEKLQVMTLCSGYDSQCLALDRLKDTYNEFDYELKYWSEIDKYACMAHNLLFPQFEGRNLGDMTKIDWEKLDHIDLLFYSTPCQSISTAGLQKGFEEGSGTRSSIIWNVRDAIKYIRPKYAILENVKAIMSSKFNDLFELWKKTIEDMGYTNYVSVMNAKDYGIPQNRERVFMVSIRNDIEKTFSFPKPFKLNLSLKDILETEVSESFYLPKDKTDDLISKLKNNVKKNSNEVISIGYIKNGENGKRHQSNTVYDIDGVSRTMTACDYKTPMLKKEPVIAAMRGRNPINPSDRTKGVHCEQRLEIKKDGTSNTITTVQKDNLVIEPKIVSYTRDNKGKIENYHFKDVSNTLHSSNFTNTQQYVYEPNEKDDEYKDNFRIRKLTPKECFRLMDVNDESFETLVKGGISKTQLYKMSGNSIVVSCLYHIFVNLFIDNSNDKETNDDKKNKYVELSLF
jgi:DNA (cytosine-5)-methyltransferase 1